MSIDQEPIVTQPALQQLAEASPTNQEAADPPTLTDLPRVPGEEVFGEPDTSFGSDANNYTVPPYGELPQTFGGWRPTTRAELENARPATSRHLLHERPSSVRAVLGMNFAQAPHNNSRPPRRPGGEGWSRPQKVVAAGLGVAGAVALAVGLSLHASSNAEHPGVQTATSGSPTPGAGTSELASPTASPSPLPSPSLFGVELAPVPTTSAANALKPVQLMKNADDDPCYDLDINEVAAAVNEVTSPLAQGTCNETPTADTYFSDAFTAPDGAQVTFRIMDDAALGAESQVKTAADGTKSLEGPGDFGQLDQVYGDNIQYSQQSLVQPAEITTYGPGAYQYQYSALQFNQGTTHEVVVHVRGDNVADGRDFILTFDDPRASEYSLQDSSAIGNGTTGNYVAGLATDLDYTMAGYNEASAQ